MAASVNRVVVVGNLTRDPELRHTAGGTPVCLMRIAVNSRRRDESGSWVDKPNYINVTVFGNQAESCTQYLAKGRPIAVDGRLDWQEWEAKDGSGHREKVEIIADSVQFLNARGDGERGGGDGYGDFVPAGDQEGDFAPASQVRDDNIDFVPSDSDSDIPF